MFAGMLCSATPLADPNNGNFADTPCAVEILWVSTDQLAALDAVGPASGQGQDLVVEWLSADDSVGAIVLGTLGTVPDVARAAALMGIELGIVADDDFPIVMGAAVAAPQVEGPTDDWREWLVPDVAAVVDGDDDGTVERHPFEGDPDFKWAEEWPDDIDDLPMDDKFCDDPDCECHGDEH